jgi:hypothetical protein
VNDYPDFLPTGPSRTWLVDPPPEEPTERAPQATAEPTVPEFLRLDAFLAQPDPEVTYRVDRLWPAGGRVLWSAQFKAGKTTGVANVLRSLVDLDPFLDTYDVHAPDGRVVLLDDELHVGTLRRWLREQRIRNVEAVDVVPLRGRLSTFDVLEDRTRSAWARRIADAGATVVVLDCLRPVLDSLGLSEDKDGGRFLVAFDELLTEAGAPEALVVHHMGHHGERSRGDSRLRDWPDAEWKLVRSGAEGVDDPTAPRFFSAYGRDVDVAEQRVALHDDGRRLYVAGGSRRDSALDDALSALLSAVRDRPGLSTRELREAVPGRNDVVDRSRLQALEDGLIEVRQEDRAKRHYLTVPNVPDRAPGTGHVASEERAPCHIGTGTHDDPAPSDDERAPGTVNLWGRCPGCNGRQFGHALCPDCARREVSA